MILTDRAIELAADRLGIGPTDLDSGHPAQHWPTIVMILTDRAIELAADRLGIGPTDLDTLPSTDPPLS
jgi:hypothetical protein